MKHDLRTALVACLVYSALIVVFAWQAFFGHTPNDAGILIVMSAFPTSSLTSPLWQLREPLAVALHLSVNDRFAMSFDAALGWLLGCFQYGILAVVIGRLIRFWR
jgi:hypothetical protein